MNLSMCECMQRGLFVAANTALERTLDDGVPQTK